MNDMSPKLDKNSRKINDLREIMQNLVDFLADENEVLRKYDFDSVKSNIDRKTTLAKLYQAQMNAVSNSEDLKAKLKENAGDLKETALELEKQMKANATLLKAGMKASELFVEAVMKAAKDHKEQESASYTGGATMNVQGAHNKTVSYNQTL